MLPHRIRLRGPWRVSPQIADDRITAQFSARTLKMPAQWEEMGLGDFRGLVRFSRSFGCPSELDTDERAWLILEGLAGDCIVWLNQERIGHWSSGNALCEIDVTERLRDRNELTFEMPVREYGAVWREAALEFRGRVWLSGLAARREGAVLELAGNLIGKAECNLDLYAILGRSPVIHAQVVARAGNQSFQFASAPLAGVAWPPSVRVELVSGGTIWHSEEVFLSS